jgi:hypothetical protein
MDRACPAHGKPPTVPGNSRASEHLLRLTFLFYLVIGHLKGIMMKFFSTLPVHKFFHYMKSAVLPTYVVYFIHTTV